MSFTEILNIIREQLPLVEIRQLDWDYRDMQNFKKEFEKIKAVENMLTTENRQKVMEIELIIEELQQSRIDLFVKQEESLEIDERQELPEDQKGKLQIKLEKEDLESNNVLKRKRKADSSSDDEYYDLDDGYKPIIKTSSYKQIKLSEKKTEENIGCCDVKKTLNGVMNPNDPMWYKVHTLLLNWLKSNTIYI